MLLFSFRKSLLLHIFVCILCSVQWILMKLPQIVVLNCLLMLQKFQIFWSFCSWTSMLFNLRSKIKINLWNFNYIATLKFVTLPFLKALYSSFILVYNLLEKLKQFSRKLNKNPIWRKFFRKILRISSIFFVIYFKLIDVFAYS